MSVTDLIRQLVTPSTADSPHQLVERYQQLRAVSKKLNTELTTRLERDVLFEGGRKLGLLHGNTFTFGSEDETAVLMDYCLYCVRRNGRSAVQQYCHEHPPVGDSDEAACLRAMQNAIYSLFRVDAVERGAGLTITDIETGEQYLLMDIGLSSSAKPGIVFLSRLLRFDDFAATGGAAVPLGYLPPDELASFCDQWKKHLVDKPRDYDPAPLIRHCLGKGLTENLRYLDPPGSPPSQPSSHRIPRKHRESLRKLAGNTDLTRRCRCGSGKMYKNCCLKKPR